MSLAEITLYLLILLLSLLCFRTYHAFYHVRRGFADETSQKLNELLLPAQTKWVVGGMMGSGKTTLAKVLSARLAIPHIEIDEFSSSEQIMEHVKALNSAGWVAEANPWQIPPPLFQMASIILFLDYSNLVNYGRLLKRGCNLWKSEGLSWSGFTKHILHTTFLDLGRIVYLYGKENRAEWRRDGFAKGENGEPAALVIRCISPAETNRLLALLAAMDVTRSATR